MAYKKKALLVDVSLLDPLEARLGVVVPYGFVDPENVGNYVHSFTDPIRNHFDLMHRGKDMLQGWHLLSAQKPLSSLIWYLQRRRITLEGKIYSVNHWVVFEGRKRTSEALSKVPEVTIIERDPNYLFVYEVVSAYAELAHRIKNEKPTS